MRDIKKYEDLEPNFNDKYGDLLRRLWHAMIFTIAMCLIAYLSLDV